MTDARPDEPNAENGHHYDEHGEPHDHGMAVLTVAAQHRRSLMLVLGLTSLYLIAEVGGGLISGSLALLADAGHTLTDVLGLSMAVFAIWFAQRPATPAKTYGFYRAEILAALLNGALPFGVAALILLEAWHRFQSPPPVSSGPMLVVAVGGVFVNSLGAWFLHGGAKDSLNLRGAFLEVVADFLGALGVLLAAVVIFFTGFRLADPIVSTIIAIFILPRAWQLLRNTLDVLLEATPRHIAVREVEAAMLSTPGVLSVHELHVWTITSSFVAMSAHVLADGRDNSDVLHDLQALLRGRFDINHATLQIERPEHSDDGTCCMVDLRCLISAPVPAIIAEPSKTTQDQRRSST